MWKRLFRLGHRTRLLVPAYYPPGLLWTRTVSAAPALGMLILNPASGPGDAPRPDLAEAAARARGAGIAVLGYVPTAWGGRPLADARRDVDRYADWYPLGGIFLDETPGQQEGSANLAYYRALATQIRQRCPRGQVVCNPGQNTSPAYLEVADVLVIFENSALRYAGWQAAEWVAAYPPERFAHLVHSVAPAAWADTCALAERRRPGWLYLTDRGLPNPWDQLPSFWDPLAARLRE